MRFSYTYITKRRLFMMMYWNMAVWWFFKSELFWTMSSKGSDALMVPKGSQLLGGCRVKGGGVSWPGPALRVLKGGVGHKGRWGGTGPAHSMVKHTLANVNQPNSHRWSGGIKMVNVFLQLACNKTSIHSFGFCMIYIWVDFENTEWLMTASNDHDFTRHSSYLNLLSW
jgi:hypothetical protein